MGEVWGNGDGMIGTVLNAVAILLGGLIGLFAGNKIPTKSRETLVSGLGLFTLAYGVLLFTKTENMLIPLASLVLGGVTGELLKIEEWLNGLGVWLQARINRLSKQDDNSARRFVSGFVAASLLFCIGPMAILGSIQDGISGNFQMLAIKSLLDGITAIAFASTMGVGVLFSAGMVFIYQGAISLVAGLAGQGFDQAVVLEMSATGGIILIGIAISNMLEIKKIRMGSFLPALVFAVVIVVLLNALGINY